MLAGVDHHSSHAAVVVTKPAATSASHSLPRLPLGTLLVHHVADNPSLGCSSIAVAAAGPSTIDSNKNRYILRFYMFIYYIATAEFVKNVLYCLFRYEAYTLNCV
jgi:hypothetical protein